MPDPWEMIHGLDPKDASDGPKDRDDDGYTNVEEFLKATDPGEKTSGAPTWHDSLRQQEGNARQRFGTARRNPLPLLRRCVDRGDLQGGTLSVWDADNQVGVGYSYSGRDVLIVGEQAYETPRLRLSAEVPAPVVLSWSSGKLDVVSSADCRLSLVPSEFVTGLIAEAARVSGARGWLATEREMARTAVARR